MFQSSPSSISARRIYNKTTKDSSLYGYSWAYAVPYCTPSHVIVANHGIDGLVGCPSQEPSGGDTLDMLVVMMVVGVVGDGTVAMRTTIRTHDVMKDLRG